jgi:predicted RND superfamily exporter protein
MAVLVVVALIGVSRIRFDTEVLNLLPQDDPVVKTFREVLSEFGSLDYLLMVVRIPEGAVVDPYLQLADELAPRLEQLEEVEFVDHHIGDLEDLIAEFFPQAFLFLDAEGRRLVEEKLEPDAIARRVVELRRHITSPQSLALRELLLIDPLGMAEVFFDRIAAGQAGVGIDWSRGYFLSRDRRLLLLLIKPSHPSQEVEFARRLVASVDEVVSETLAGWPEIAGEDAPPPPVVDLGGAAAITVEDAGLLTREILSNALSSLVVVLALFVITFRRLGLVVYAFLPLTAGLLLAFGFAGLTVGTLNIMTAGFVASLVGLGIDFVIVSYGRYAHERNRGQRLSTALRRMCGSTGRAVLSGAVTTTVAFYAFLATQFVGLRQMGFLIGTGVLFCMASVLTLLPALLAWREDRRRAVAPETADRVLHFRGFGAAAVIRWSFDHPTPVLVVGGILTVGAAWSATGIEFVDSIRAMRPLDNRAMQVQDEVAERFGSGFDYMMLVIDAPDEDSLLERTAMVTDRTQELVAQGILQSVDSVSSILAPPQRQREGLDWLERMRGTLLRPGRVESLFAQHAAAEGVRAEPFAGGFELLQRAAAIDQPSTLATLAQSDESRRLLGRYLRQLDGVWKSVVYLHPPPRVWKRQAPPEVEALATAFGEDVVLTGTNRVSQRLRTQVRRDAVVAAILGTIAVTGLLWIDYRRIGDTLLSLAPLSVGLIWAMGTMAALGLDLNFFNAFVITMVIGIGIDYGVHMIHRYHELRHRHESGAAHGGHQAMVEELGETGKAVVIAAISTSVGFGSMSFSHYPGLRSMGYLAVLGALACALVAITMLPAVMSLRLRAREAHAPAVEGAQTSRP